MVVVGGGGLPVCVCVLSLVSTGANHWHPDETIVRR